LFLLAGDLLIAPEVVDHRRGHATVPAVPGFVSNHFDSFSALAFRRHLSAHVGAARAPPKGSTTMNTTTETTTAAQAAAAAAPGAPVVPKASKTTSKTTRKATSTKKAATRAKGAKGASAKPKLVKGAKGAKKAAKAATPREGSKKQIVLDMLRAKGGATMAEIQKATDWQAHSVRGFISGALGKKMGLAIESTKNGAGERCYKIAK
jgi:hypothetical protein